MSQKKNVFKLHIWLVRPQLFSHKVEIIQLVTMDLIPSEIDFAQDLLVAVVVGGVGQTLRSMSVYIPKVLVLRLDISALTFLSVHNLMIHLSEPDLTAHPGTSSRGDTVNETSSNPISSNPSTALSRMLLSYSCRWIGNSNPIFHLSDSIRSDS